MSEAKPIDPQELVKWLVALRRAINSRDLQA
ncbi:hypothetical protein [Pseudomonas sp. 25 R 14]|jgi:hypothetical protein|nr:hypothetical protein [Pseudomonas sp. 25 R 14]